MPIHYCPVSFCNEHTDEDMKPAACCYPNGLQANGSAVVPILFPVRVQRALVLFLLLAALLPAVFLAAIAVYHLVDGLTV